MQELLDACWPTRAEQLGCKRKKETADVVSWGGYTCAFRVDGLGQAETDCEQNVGFRPCSPKRHANIYIGR